jgi:hypothetical protein
MIVCMRVHLRNQLPYAAHQLTFPFNALRLEGTCQRSNSRSSEQLIIIYYFFAKYNRDADAYIYARIVILMNSTQPCTFTSTF